MRRSRNTINKIIDDSQHTEIKLVDALNTLKSMKTMRTMKSIQSMMQQSMIKQFMSSRVTDTASVSMADNVVPKVFPKSDQDMNESCNHVSDQS